MSDSSIESLVGDRARDDNGRFKSVTPTEDPAPVVTPEPVVEPVAAAPVIPPPVTPVEPTETDAERGLRRGLQEEREKRQRIEAELRELRAPKTPPVDPWTDLPGAIKAQEQQFEDRLYSQTCNISERFARSVHKDYDEVRDVFIEAAKANPILFAQMRQAEDPATFAYNEGLRVRELKDVNGDFGAYRTKLETELRAKLETEYQTKYGVKPTPVVPVSLNSDASPPVAEPVYAGPQPLNKILRNASRS